MNCIDEVVDKIHLAYTSLENPDFSFVSRSIAQNPYADAVHQLSNLFEVEEDTDPNCDVSFKYILTRAAATLVLRLSMVGPYAILLRIDEDGETKLLSEDTASLSDEEKGVREILAKGGLSLLDHELLTQPVPLTPRDPEDDVICIYQALFTETDYLPWEKIPEAPIQ